MPSCFRRSAGRAIYRSHAHLILSELGEYLGYSPPLLERLFEDTQKIHKQQPISSRKARYRPTTDR